MRRGMGTLTTRIRAMTARVVETGRDHQEFLLLLALFVSLRLSLLVISRPQGYLLDISDYNFYLQFGQMADQGLYPDLQYWTEYPPIFPWLAVAAYKVVEGLPTIGGSPLLWFRMALGSVLLLFDIGNLVLIYWLGCTLHGKNSGLQIGWIYALLFTPLAVWLGWFDTMPLFFLLLGTALIVNGKPRGAALAAGLGFMVKVLPILVLPVLLKVERRLWRRPELVAWAGLAAAAVAAPFLLLAPQYLAASFLSMTSRSPWETVWAIAEDYYGYGWVTPLQNRFDPSTATDTTYTSHLPWMAISLAFAAIYLLIWTRPLHLEQPFNVVAFSGLTLNIFMLYSKGYSPQFLLYLVPFALLVLPRWRAVTYITVLSCINLLEYPVYVVLFRDQNWIMRDLVFMRSLLLLILTWEYLTLLGLLPSLVMARRLAAYGTITAFLGWGLISIPAAGNEWVHSSQERDPNAAMIDYLAANAGPSAAVVFTDPGLYRALYPYLFQRTNLLLIDPAIDDRIASLSLAGRSVPSNRPDLATRLDQIASTYSEVFSLSLVSDQRWKQVGLLLATREVLIASRRVNDLSVNRWRAK